MACSNTLHVLTIVPCQLQYRPKWQGLYPENMDLLLHSSDSVWSPDQQHPQRQGPC